METNTTTYKSIREPEYITQVIKLARESRERGYTWAETARGLGKLGFTTRNGGKLNGNALNMFMLEMDETEFRSRKYSRRGAVTGDSLTQTTPADNHGTPGVYRHPTSMDVIMAVSTSNLSEEIKRYIIAGELHK